MNLEMLRTCCLALPATTEDIKWEVNLCFLVGGKIFCAADTSSLFSVAFKCTTDDFEMLTAREGIEQAPYFARNKWVRILEPNALSISEWKAFVNNSYGLVVAGLTKKQRQQLGLH